MEYKKLRFPFLILLVALAGRELFPRNHSVMSSWQPGSEEVTQSLIYDFGGPEYSKPILLIGADWCSSCRAARGRLADIGVDYFYADIDRSEHIRETFEQLSTPDRGGLPMLLVGERAYFGYNENIIKAYVKY